MAVQAIPHRLEESSSSALCLQRPQSLNTKPHDTLGHIALISSQSQQNIMGPQYLSIEEDHLLSGYGFSRILSPDSTYLTCCHSSSFQLPDAGFKWQCASESPQ